jgi:hypothetical protein
VDLGVPSLKNRALEVCVIQYLFHKYLLSAMYIPETENRCGIYQSTKTNNFVFSYSVPTTPCIIRLIMTGICRTALHVKHHIKSMQIKTNK